MGQTLYDKLWAAHTVRVESDGSTLLYVDRHLVHEVTSPQAFEGLRLAGRPVWRSGSIVATADHNVPTRGVHGPRSRIPDRLAREQVAMLDANVRASGALAYFPWGDAQQGILHVVGPELGAILPGMTVVCGDSHTATHGALGCLGQGIGTSEVEQVLASQCLLQKKSGNLLVRISGALPTWVAAKDLALAVVRRLGCGGGTGHVIEFAGDTVRALSMEGRMTLCNMAIEAGARSGLIGVDDTTLAYLQGRPHAPQGALWAQAVAAWRDLRSDVDAGFDRVVEIDAAGLRPQVSWGTTPDMVVDIDDRVPAPEDYAAQASGREAAQHALRYMGLQAGTPLREIAIDKVFIGSCTNGRIEDLRAAAAVARGRHKAASVQAVLVVPGSGRVRQQAEAEGLDQVFLNAGFEWRSPGCSMCLGMNEDRLLPGERCASTSNRNFEGRQGAGGRSHLLSPALAVAAAITGHLTSPADLPPLISTEPGA